jgi:hypothetical protein
MIKPIPELSSSLSSMTMASDSGVANAFTAVTEGGRWSSGGGGWDESDDEFADAASLLLKAATDATILDATVCFPPCVYTGTRPTVDDTDTASA